MSHCDYCLEESKYGHYTFHLDFFLIEMFAILERPDNYFKTFYSIEFEQEGNIEETKQRLLIPFAEAIIEFMA